MIAVLFALLSRFTYKTQSSVLYVNPDSGSSSLKDSVPPTDTLSENPNINETELMGKELFAQYMTVRQSGNLNNQTSDSIVKDLTSKISDNPTPFYHETDLNIIDKASTDDLKNYANKFWSIRQRYIKIYSDAINKSKDSNSADADTTLIQNFVLAGNLYSDMASELIKLPVPSELANLHLKIANNEQTSGSSLKKLNKLDTDPIVTITGLATYKRYSEYETTMLKIMARYFKESGIIFDNKDPGIGWSTL